MRRCLLLHSCYASLRPLTKVVPRRRPPYTLSSFARLVSTMPPAGVSTDPASSTQPARVSAASVHSSPAPAPLVLHFDVNQTLILADSVQAVTAEAATNMICADHAWGSAADAHWQLVHSELSIEQPQPTSSSSLSSPLVTYSDWLEKVHPATRRLPELSVEENRERKATRADLRSRFTEAGQPGAPLAPTCRRLDALTRLPDSPLLERWPTRSYYILPAFYLFALWLQHTRRAFMLLFRTFGQDIPDVQREWNHFCAGRHPAFPFVSLDGSGRRSETERYVDAEGVLAQADRMPHATSAIGEGGAAGQKEERNLIDRRLSDANCGYGYRTGDTADDSHLLIGAVPHASLPDSLTLPLTHSDWTHLTAHSSLTAMSAYLAHMQSQQATLAIRDFHAYWEGRGRSAGSGKVILVDKAAAAAEGEPARVRAVFFDDTLHDNIVDARAMDGAALTADEARRYGVVLHHARCLRIVQQPNYFIRVLQEAEAE